MSNKKNNSKKSSLNRRNKNGNNNEINTSDKIYLSKKEYEKNKKKEKKHRNIIPLLVLIIGFALGVYFYLNMTEPSKVVKQYFKLLNEGKYEEISKKGREYVKSNDWEAITDKFENALNDLVE